MKHHRHAQGWRESNDMTTEQFINELCALVVAYVGVMIVVGVIVWQLCRR